ncbi:hypothetical protein B7P43_G10685 [Cryptotermes secundus]|uniref:Uncharacterized protein n=1 Tax=Cryptotermes secundus TaxID=105785 RepID=A0A2J7R5S7_9NEOP|nr:hypothetical protein B7P43_G10685 [Cryptotermes secundus]
MKIEPGCHPAPPQALGIVHRIYCQRSNGMLLSHLEKNRDAIPLHPAPPQALSCMCKFNIPKANYRVSTI